MANSRSVSILPEHSLSSNRLTSRRCTQTQTIVVITLMALPLLMAHLLPSSLASVFLPLLPLAALMEVLPADIIAEALLPPSPTTRGTLAGTASTARVQLALLLPPGLLLLLLPSASVQREHSPSAVLMSTALDAGALVGPSDVTVVVEEPIAGREMRRSSREKIGCSSFEWAA